MGCHALLQGIFPIQGSNPGLPCCRRILYHLSHQGNPLQFGLLQFCLSVFLCLWVCVNVLFSIQLYHVCRFVYPPPQSRYKPVPAPQDSLSWLLLLPLFSPIPTLWQPFICSPCFIISKFFKKIFRCGPFLKSLLNFAFFFFFKCFGFSGRQACGQGILTPWPRREPASPILEGETLTTGLPGKSLKIS